MVNRICLQIGLVTPCFQCGVISTILFLPVSDLPPRFADTMPSEITISESTGRTSIFTISVTDDDHQDIDSLQVTMHNLSSVFSFDSNCKLF